MGQQLRFGPISGNNDDQDSESYPTKIRARIVRRDRQSDHNVNLEETPFDDFCRFKQVESLA